MKCKKEPNALFFVHVQFTKKAVKKKSVKYSDDVNYVIDTQKIGS